MMLLWVRPTPSRSRAARSAAGKPLPRTSPARSQVPTKTSGSRCTLGSDGEQSVLPLAAGQIHAEAARLPAPQCRVMAACREQGLVGLRLEDTASVEPDEPVRAANWRHPLR